MRQLTLDELENLALGSAILGSGGGGNPAYDLLMAKHEIEKYGPVTLLQIEDLKESDLVMPMGFMGAPLVAMERLLCGREFDAMLKVMPAILGRKPTVLMPGEAAGSNAFAPLIFAGRLGLPVLDADLIGRAFPQLQMSICELKGVPIAPVFLGDAAGNVATVHTSSAHEAERISRQIAISMGSCCAYAMYCMAGHTARSSVVPGTITRGISMGSSIRAARKQGREPLKALLEENGGCLLGSGVINNIDQVVKDGFLEGSVSVDDGVNRITIVFQNEYLYAERNGKVSATTPDIIMLLEAETATPITSDTLRYGLRVNAIALPAHEGWQTPEGLALVGPRYFGYEVDYQPVNAGAPL